MYLTRYLLTEPLGGKKVLLINCLSGAVDILDQENFKHLKNLEAAKIEKEVLYALTKRGYIFEDENAEVEFLKKMHQRYMAPENYRFVDLVVCPTFDCNLACSYCFQNGLKERQMYLTKNDIKPLSAALSKMIYMLPGKKAIQLFGGEPLLPKNKEVVELILDYANKNKLPVAMTTNGTTIENFNTLIKRYCNTIKVIQVTLDGPPRVHNKRRVPPSKKPTFDTIINGIKFLLSCGIAVQARVNVDKTNILALPELVDHLEENKLLSHKNFKCSLAPVEDHCSEEKTKSLLKENELIKELEKISLTDQRIEALSYERIPKTIKHLYSLLNDEYSGPRFTYCASNRKGYFIFAPDGLIYACSEAAGHKELAIGRFIPSFKLYESKLDLWSKRSILDIDKCRKCAIAPICGGGCSYAAYSINGDILKPYCHEAHEVIRSYIKDKKKELLTMALGAA